MTRFLLTLFFAVFITQAAYSQPAPDMKDRVEPMEPNAQTLGMGKQTSLDLYDDTRRKIGFMKYCGEKQLLNSETAKTAVHTYTRAIELLFYDKETASHRSYDRQSGDEAERQASLGIMYYKDWAQMFAYMPRWLHPSGKSLDDYAKTRNVTPAAMCKQWADESTTYDPIFAMHDRLDERAKNAIPSGSAGK
jgi:hypothetical protein